MSTHSAQSQKIPHHLLAFRGEDALRMKLHTFDRMLLVPQTHNRAAAIGFSCPGADLEFRRKAFLLDDQRVIPRCGERTSNISEDGPAIMRYLAGFTMHEMRRADHLAAKSGSQRLVAEADAQDRHPPGKAPKNVNAD